ncbi:Hypothetical protein SRAE_X000038800 [Strongyloides ratti]|uniref:Uncharacterized protein n=1 Tax=Strongyloides ratti TaxID=34506 RepID=A0A090LMT5_STRRB|nr:Hypothetical protein SRAE_X000038800 [Strongyloides ratti]CEF71061.1 Hypothetical protein SRAE_X000038800 [Strongyloides ratti]
MKNLSSLVFIILVGFLFISKTYELINQNIADNSLTVKDVPIVVLNDEVDNHNIEKRQRRGRNRRNRNRNLTRQQRRKRRRRRRNRNRNNNNNPVTTPISPVTTAPGGDYYEYYE